MTNKLETTGISDVPMFVSDVLLNQVLGEELLRSGGSGGAGGPGATSGAQRVRKPSIVRQSSKEKLQEHLRF